MLHIDSNDSAAVLLRNDLFVVATHRADVQQVQQALDGGVLPVPGGPLMSVNVVACCP